MQLNPKFHQLASNKDAPFRVNKAEMKDQSKFTASLQTISFVYQLKGTDEYLRNILTSSPPKQV